MTKRWGSLLAHSSHVKQKMVSSSGCKRLLFEATGVDIVSLWAHSLATNAFAEALGKANEDVLRLSRLLDVPCLQDEDPPGARSGAKGKATCRKRRLVYSSKGLAYSDPLELHLSFERLPIHPFRERPSIGLQLCLAGGPLAPSASCVCVCVFLEGNCASILLTCCVISGNGLAICFHSI